MNTRLIYQCPTCQRWFLEWRDSVIYMSPLADEAVLPSEHGLRGKTVRVRIERSPDKRLCSASCSLGLLT